MKPPTLFDLSEDIRESLMVSLDNSFDFHCRIYGLSAESSTLFNKAMEKTVKDLYAQIKRGGIKYL